MKRKLILLVVTIVFLVGFGVILHSPPSMIDAVTGATPKSKKGLVAKLICVSIFIEVRLIPITP